MGNTVGKKKKLSTASSAKWVAPEVQPKKDVLSPLGRSYSMPVHNAKPKSDNYHVVALTSSTYGILKVDVPKDADERRHTRPPGRAKDGRVESHGHSHSLNFQENLRKFEIPEIMVPKPWSDVDQILTKFQNAASDGKAQEQQPVEGLKVVKEEGPETINMWELMEGLDDDRSPYSLLATPTPTSAAAANAVGAAGEATSPPRVAALPVVVAAAPNPAVAMAKKARNLESSLSFSAVHTVTEVDADFLEGAVRSELQAAVESDTLVTGKCYDVVPSPSLPPHGSFLGRAKVNAGTATGAAAAASGASLVASIPPRHQGQSGKENDSSSPAVLREAALSTLTPAQLNTPPVTAHAPQSGVRDSKGRNNSNSGSAVGSKNVNPFISRGGGGASDSPRVKQPVGGDTPAAIVKSNSMEASSATSNSKGFSSSAQRSNPLPPRHRGGSENTAYTSPFGFTTSSSEDSEDRGQLPQESPLFDPELLASFEKAIEDVSEDEWYRVRRSDAGAASTSGSSSDRSDDSPTRPPHHPSAIVGPSPTSSNNTHQPNSTIQSQASVAAAVASFEGLQSPSAPLSPSPRTRKPDTDGGNTRKMSSKVAPVDFRDLVLKKVRKEDPFEKFEQLCPPGGEARVVIYVTSLRGIRKTFEDCSHMKLVILGYRVAIDERDVSMHADFKQELKDLLGKPMPVPRLFIRGRYIGGAEDVSSLHEDGTLGKLLETMPTQTSWEQCDGCGGHRFVPCSECSGSCKIITEDDEVARCTECNENGLVRCPICF